MFLLATVTVTFTATIDTNPPKAGGAGARPADGPTLGLTVLIVNDGFSVKAKGGDVAPGCQDLGAGLGMGKTPDGKDYDFRPLHQVHQLHLKLVADSADKTTVTARQPQHPYQALIGTMMHPPHGGRQGISSPT